MSDMSKLFKSSWGAEKWIAEGWEVITEAEQRQIIGRMDDLFKDGLPLELKHDRVLYLYTFAMLAQLEVLAIQVPLKFESRMTNGRFRKTMRQQLLDEIFHGLVFTKIAFELAAPYAKPPEYNDAVERLCDFIRGEEDPKVAIVLLNLIGEGWIEEIFYAMKRNNIAPKVFDVILADEHRHVCEADMYRELGLPSMDDVRTKLDFLENHLLTHVFLQHKYVISACHLLGIEGVSDFLNALGRKHEQQLAKINLEPGEKWQAFLSMTGEIHNELNLFRGLDEEVKVSPTRKVLMSQWDNPRLPTMSTGFGLDVSCLGLLEKKFPSETLTGLMVQAISQCFSETAEFRHYLCHNKVYRARAAYVGLVVQLPNCFDQLGTIIFQDCHQLSITELSSRVRNIVTLMAYCFDKCESLLESHPHLQKYLDDLLSEQVNGVFEDPLFGNPVVSVSNIGRWGFEWGVSPLRPGEMFKFTLTKVEKKQVWDKETKAFEIKDIVPVNISVDHRVFDANHYSSDTLQRCFNAQYQKMLGELQHPRLDEEHRINVNEFAKLIEQMLCYDLESGFKILVMARNVWPDFSDVVNMLKSTISVEKLKQQLEAAE